jgi:hypothetical protein
MRERAGSTQKPMCPQVVSWQLPQLLNDDAIICGDSGTRDDLAGADEAARWPALLVQRHAVE